jgi:hypothetical protein
MTGDTKYALIPGILWGIFAAKQQFKRTPTKYSKILITFALNFVAWPIGIIVAIIKQ